MSSIEMVELFEIDGVLSFSPLKLRTVHFTLNLKSSVVFFGQDFVFSVEFRQNFEFSVKFDRHE